MSKRVAVLLVILFCVTLAAVMVKPAKAIRQVQTPDGQTYVLFTLEEMDKLETVIGLLVAERDRLRAEILLLRKQCT